MKLFGTFFLFCLIFGFFLKFSHVKNNPVVISTQPREPAAENDPLPLVKKENEVKAQKIIKTKVETNKQLTERIKAEPKAEPKVELTPEEPSALGPVRSLTETPSESLPIMWTWVGTGLGFAIVEQTSTDGTSLKINSVKPLLQTYGLGLNVTDTIGLQASYRLQPGSVSSKDSLSVSQGEFNLNTLSLEAIYSLSQFQNDVVHFGIQKLELPVAIPDGGQIRLAQVSQSMATLGFESKNQSSSNWKTHYQFNLGTTLDGESGGSNYFEPKSSILANFKIGKIYQFKNSPTHLGFYWSNFYLNQKFDAQINGQAKMTGQQEILNSEVQAVFGWELK